MHGWTLHSLSPGGHLPPSCQWPQHHPGGQDQRIAFFSKQLRCLQRARGYQNEHNAVGRISLVRARDCLRRQLGTHKTFLVQFRKFRDDKHLTFRESVEKVTAAKQRAGVRVFRVQDVTAALQSTDQHARSEREAQVRQLEGGHREQVQEVDTEQDRATAER
jgi:hypothetical protein